MFAYYGLIMLSTFMFGVNFICTDQYRRERGWSVLVSMQYSFVAGAIGLAVFLLIHGFRFSCTPFVFVMGLLSALNGFGFSLCSFKSLGVINLSLYSLLSMLGGMLLPFLQGVLFYEEPLTVANVICFALIIFSLLVASDMRGRKQGGSIYYIGVFLLNGMSGVLAKLYHEAPFNKGSADPSVSYSVMAGVISVVIAGILILFLSERQKEPLPKMTRKSNVISGMGGILNRAGNYLLMIALLVVPSTVQFPMVTGGVMIFSTLACYLTDRKPSKREWLSVIIAFVALVILVLPTLDIELFCIRFG